MTKEKIPILLMYKEEGKMNIEFSRDSESDYEIYAFLKLITKKMQNDMLEDIELK